MTHAERGSLLRRRHGPFAAVRLPLSLIWKVPGKVYTLAVRSALLLSTYLVAVPARSAELKEFPAAKPAAITPAAVPVLPVLPALTAVPGLDAALALPDAPPIEAALPGATLSNIANLIAAISSPFPEAAAPREPGPALESFWTGGFKAAVPAGADGVLSAQKPRQLQALEAVVAKAWEAPTGRRVLRAAKRLADKKGAVPAELRELGKNYGEYDYLEQALYINKELAASDVREAAAALVHELTHVLQHARGVPAESLEMELEAHVVTLQVLAELGVRPGGKSFSAAALRELKKSPAAYIAWMENQLPGKLKLIGADFDELAESLEQEADEVEERIAQLGEKLSEKPDSALLLRRLEREQGRAKAVARDLAIVRSPAGRRRCLAFAEHVRKVLSRFHAAQVGPKAKKA